MARKDVLRIANRRDLTGEVFGRYTVLGPAEPHITPNGAKAKMWHCRCACGTEKDVYESNLLHSKNQSCGCYTLDRLTKHGMTGTKLYGVWQGMIRRCTYKKHIDYEWYQSKGISVCDEWGKNFLNFYDWSMTHGYEEGLTLDRIDNNKGYCPENCRWVTPKEQANNRSTNINITYNGETKTLKQWAEFLGINYSCLYGRVRVRGIPFEEAINY